MQLSIEKPGSWRTFLAAQGAHFDAHDRVTGFHSEVSDPAASLSATALVPLTHLAVIRVCGDDASQFLQSQVTSDIRLVSPASAQFSGYCTPKGRLLATFVLMFAEGGYLLLLPRELAGAVASRLRKFVLRSRVKIEEALDSIAVLGLAGHAASSVARDAFGVAPDRAMSVVAGSDVFVVGLPGECLLLISQAKGAPSLWQRLADRVAPAGVAAWDWRLLRAGIATILMPTQEAFLPQMLNMQDFGAVSFQKGCFPGQEIIARTQYLGDLKRRLFFARCHDQPDPGDAVVETGGTGEVAGTVVNAAQSPERERGWELAAVLARDAVSKELRLRSRSGALVELEKTFLAETSKRP